MKFAKKMMIGMFSIMFFSGCSIVDRQEISMYHSEVEAKVLASRYLDKVCMERDRITKKEYYHSDIMEKGFFNSFPTENVVPKDHIFEYECAIDVYKTKVMLTGDEIESSRYLEVITKDKRKKGEIIKIMKKD